MSARRLNAKDLLQLRELADAIRENLNEDVLLLESTYDGVDDAFVDDTNASAANLVEALTDYLLGRWRVVTAEPGIEDLGGDLIVSRLERRDYVVLDPVAARAEALRVDPQGPDDFSLTPHSRCPMYFMGRKSRRTLLASR